MFPQECRWRQTNHECVHPSWLADAANVGLHPSCNVERVSSTNNVKSNGSVTTTQPIVKLTKYPGRRHTILDTNSTIAHDANNHAMNTTCMCNPKHSSNCIQVSGNAIGRHPATTQTQINHNMSETAHTPHALEKGVGRERTRPMLAHSELCKFAFHLRALAR